MGRELPRIAGTLILCLAALLPAPDALASRLERLSLQHVTLDLPGPPSKVIPFDLNRDRLMDLVVVVAYTEVESLAQDRIENMIQVTTVIPALFDRREVRAYLATAAGDYLPAGAPLELPTSILHMEAGPPGLGVLALTDAGLSRLRYAPDGDGPVLRLDPLIDDPPVLARTGSFYASLKLVHDLDGDGTADLLLPGSRDLAVYLGTPSGLRTEAVERIAVPADVQRSRGFAHRWYPLPEVREINGDGLPDLVFNAGLAGEDSPGIDVLPGIGGGRFGTLREQPVDCHDRLTDLRIAAPDDGAYPWPEGLSAFRDLDGDGRAEAITSTYKPRGDSMRKGLKDAKRPIQLYRFHRLAPDLSVDLQPYFETRIVGHTMEDEREEEGSPFRVEQFADLDGDGREDLVTLTLDFSIFQALKILATKRISIGIDFHVYAQQADGSFVKVPDLDLSEKLKLDLNNLEVGRFAQFAGDFDGDGRQDFIHLGRGRIATLHAGRPGCRYPKKPDLSIDLEQEPPSLDLVRIEDLDGDGLSDLAIARPLPSTDVDETAPVRLDLYLSRGGS